MSAAKTLKAVRDAGVRIAIDGHALMLDAAFAHRRFKDFDLVEIRVIADSSAGTERSATAKGSSLRVNSVEDALCRTAWANGSCREVFLDASAKSGTQVASDAHDLAVVVRLSLRHGVPIQTLRRAVTRDGRGNAAGPIGRLLDIPEAEDAR